MADNTTTLKNPGVATIGDTEAADELREAKRDLDNSGPRIVDSAQRAKEALTEGLDTAKVKAREVAEQTQTKVREGYEQARQGAERARDTAQERYTELSGQVREGYVKARKDIDDLAGNANDYVRDNPGKSVLVAAAVGFLVGLLMSGSRNDS